MQKDLIQASITDKGLDIYHSTPVEKPDMFYKKILFVRYLADPSNTTGEAGMLKFSELTGVPIPVLRRWRNSKEVQGLVVQTARDYALDGDGMALVYKEAHRILSSGDSEDDNAIIDRFEPSEGIEVNRQLLQEFLHFLRKAGLFVSNQKQKTDIIKTLLRIDDKRIARAERFVLEKEKVKQGKSSSTGKSYEERIEEAEYEVVDDE